MIKITFLVLLSLTLNAHEVTITFNKEQRETLKYVYETLTPEEREMIDQHMRQLIEQTIEDKSRICIEFDDSVVLEEDCD